jgi:hypothetical protein
MTVGGTGVKKELFPQYIAYNTVVDPAYEIPSKGFSRSGDSKRLWGHLAVELAGPQKDLALTWFVIKSVLDKLMGAVSREGPDGRFYVRLEDGRLMLQNANSVLDIDMYMALAESEALTWDHCQDLFLILRMEIQRLAPEADQAKNAEILDRGMASMEAARNNVALQGGAFLCALQALCDSVDSLGVFYGNERLGTVKQLIIDQAVPYFSAKFVDAMAAGTVGLDCTRVWVRRTVATLGDYPNVFKDAVVRLVLYDEAEISGESLPEVLVLAVDQLRKLRRDFFDAVERSAAIAVVSDGRINGRVSDEETRLAIQKIENGEAFEVAASIVKAVVLSRSRELMEYTVRSLLCLNTLTVHVFSRADMRDINPIFTTKMVDRFYEIANVLFRIIYLMDGCHGERLISILREPTVATLPQVETAVHEIASVSISMQALLDVSSEIVTSPFVGGGGPEAGPEA